MCTDVYTTDGDAYYVSDGLYGIRNVVSHNLGNVQVDLRLHRWATALNPDAVDQALFGGHGPGGHGHGPDWHWPF